MRELKVQCDCGQKFKFDVEPVNNQMPFTVACPICNRDGTEKANMLLRAQAGVAPAPAGVPIPLTHAMPVPPPPTPMPMAAAVASAPAPMPASLIPAPPSPSAQSRLRIGTMAPAAPPPVLGEGNVPPPPPISPMPGRLPNAVASAEAPKKTSFAKGILGGFIGAVVGSVAYYFLLKFTDLWALRLAAIGVGALAGWLAEVMGKGEGSNELGVITAVLVLAGIVGAQYFIALGWWNQFSPDKLLAAAFQEQVKEAKTAVQAVPTGSDAEIRAYLAKQESDFGEKVTADKIPADEVQEFHDKQLPEYKELASGDLTWEQYMQKHGVGAHLREDLDADRSTFKGVFLLLLLNKASLFSIIGAAGLAYKMSTNA